VTRLRPGLWLTWVLLLALPIGIAASLVGSGTTISGAATYTYDAPVVTRVDVQRIAAAAGSTEQLSGVSDGPASPSVEFRGTSTTLHARGVATEAGAGLGDDALAYATRAEKLDHIFVPKHNLDPLVQQLGGREAVVEQMLSGVKGLTPASGTFEIPVTISGQTVVVRGAVVNGVVKLGTAFTP